MGLEVRSCHESSELTMAALRHFFILHRRSSFADVVEHVQDLVELELPAE